MKSVAVGVAAGGAMGAAAKKKPGESRTEKVLRGILLGGLTGGAFGSANKAAKTYEKFFRRGASQTKPGVSVSDAVKNLGLNKDSIKTKIEVKKKYRGLALKHHPDKGGSQDKMSKLNESWTKIKNSDWYEKLAFLRGDNMSKANNILNKLAQHEPTPDQINAWSTPNTYSPGQEKKKGLIPFFQRLIPGGKDGMETVLRDSEGRTPEEFGELSWKERKTHSNKLQHETNEKNKKAKELGTKRPGAALYEKFRKKKTTNETPVDAGATGTGTGTNTTPAGGTGEAPFYYGDETQKEGQWNTASSGENIRPGYDQRIGSGWDNLGNRSDTLNVKMPNSELNLIRHLKDGKINWEHYGKNKGVNIKLPMPLDEGIKGTMPSVEQIEEYHKKDGGKLKKEGSHMSQSKADVVLEKIASMAALKSGLKMIDKGIQTLGRKVVGAVKKTKIGKKKLKGKVDARTKKVKRIAGGATVGAGAYAGKKIVD